MSLKNDRWKEDLHLHHHINLHEEQIIDSTADVFTDQQCIYSCVYLCNTRLFIYLFIWLIDDSSLYLCDINIMAVYLLAGFFKRNIR